MFKHILVPLDGSELAGSVLPMVESLAKALQARVMLVRVVDVGSITRSVTPAAPTAGFTPEMQQVVDDTLNAERDQAAAYLQEVASRLEQAGVNVQQEVREGLPPDELLTAVEDESIDIAVVATHGRSGITRTLFGSVADHLMRNSGKPILMVKPKEEE